MHTELRWLSALALAVFQRSCRRARNRKIFVSGTLAIILAMLVANLSSCGGGNAAPNNPVAKIPPTITTSSLPSGIAYSPYQQTTLAATGGTPPYTWSLTSAASTFPPGLSISSSGTIGGTTEGPLVYDFTLQVADSANLSASASLSITINSGALTASPTALNFSTTAAQSFIVEGGSGVVSPPSEDCSGIATLTAPQGFPPFSGTWNVSPISNGACNATFTDGLTLATTSVAINVDIQPGELSNDSNGGKLRLQ